MRVCALSVIDILGYVIAGSNFAHRHLRYPLAHDFNLTFNDIPLGCSVWAWWRVGLICDFTKSITTKLPAIPRIILCSLPSFRNRYIRLSPSLLTPFSVYSSAWKFANVKFIDTTWRLHPVPLPSVSPERTRKMPSEGGKLPSRYDVYELAFFLNSPV